MHSAISDASGTPDEVLARAAVRGLDFATLTDHDTVGGSRMLPSEYAEISWLTDLFNRIEGFTTLHAYEWTTPMLPQGAGHRNVYFEGHGPEEVYTKGTGQGETRTLFEALRSERAFAVPHHTSWTGTEWDLHDEAIQRHVEVVSVHGAADAPGGPVPSRGEMPGMFAVDGLKRGLRFGFVAGTDGHGLIYHHGIARHRDPWAHALTGVLAPSGDRAALWNALYQRRTWGTSGPKTQVYLRAGRAWQGELLATQPEEVQYEVRAQGRILALEVFRDGELWKRLPLPQAPTRRAQGRIPLTGESRFRNLFLRVTEKGVYAEKEASWSSPLFIGDGG
jgi:hypothetical protein